MRRLILFRHAKTERDAPSGRDQDRRLDARGREDAAAMGRWLARQRYRPSLALVSTAARAEQTWTLVEDELAGARIEYVPELYGADPSDILRIIRGVDLEDPACLMIVAHNPGLHELALALITGDDSATRRALAINLPTAGVVVIDFAAGQWRDVTFRTGTLECFATPKLLRERSDD
jgi:phosphohistidine phosphatase